MSRSRAKSAGPSSSMSQSKNTQLSGREVSALLPSLPENSKRNRNLSDAAVLRLVTEWEAQERRVRNREAKDIRRARAASVMAEPSASDPSSSDDFVFAVPVVPNRLSRSTSIPNFVLRSSSLEPSIGRGTSRNHSGTPVTTSPEGSVAGGSRKNYINTGTPSRETSIALESRKNSINTGTSSRESSVAGGSRKNSITNGTPSRESSVARGSRKNSMNTGTPSRESSVARGTRKNIEAIHSPTPNPLETSESSVAARLSRGRTPATSHNSIGSGISDIAVTNPGTANSSLRSSRLSSILRDDKARYNRALSVSFDIDDQTARGVSTESEDASASNQLPQNTTGRRSRKSPGPGPSRISPRHPTKRPHSSQNVTTATPAKRNNVRHCSHRSKMNEERREQMKNSECIVDECPSCTVPLITNPILKTIDIDDYEDRQNMARPHINKRLCMGGLVANQLVYNDEGKLIRRTDLLGVIRRRVKDKFKIEEEMEIPDNFFITGLEGIAFKENYLTPDIVLNPEHFTKATSDMPTRLKMMICSFPTWAKDMYFSMRRMYEVQIQAIIKDRGIGSTLFDHDIPPRRSSNVPCYCDKYNLKRCGDKNSKCCDPEMLEMIARCLDYEDDSDTRE